MVHSVTCHGVFCHMSINERVHPENGTPRARKRTRRLPHGKSEKNERAHSAEASALCVFARQEFVRRRVSEFTKVGFLRCDVSNSDIYIRPPESWGSFNNPGDSRSYVRRYWTQGGPGSGKGKQRKSVCRLSGCRGFRSDLSRAFNALSPSFVPPP